MILNNKSFEVLKITITVLVMLISETSSATPVFSLSFEQGLKADILSENGSIESVGKIEYVSGKIGRAIKTNSNGYVKISDKNLLNSKEGTVEFWIKPIDWVPGDGKFHVFFETEGNGRLVLYKYYNNKKLFFYSNPKALNNSSYSTSRNIDWEAGQWHHVAGSWSQNNLMLYIDGEKVSNKAAEAVLPSYFNGNILIGDRAWGTRRKSSTIIDEFKIYKTMLSPEVIKLHSKGVFNVGKYLNPNDIWIKSTTNFKNNAVQLELVNSQYIFKKSDIILIYLNGKQFGKHKVQSNNIEKDLVWKFSVSEIYENEGRNQLRVLLLRNGDEELELSHYYDLPKLNWGAEEKEIPSVKSSSIKNDRNSIFVWGRKITFKSSVFPTSIVSQENTLLAEPAKLVLNKNPNRYIFNPVGAKKKIQTDLKELVTYKQKLTLEVADKEHIFNVKTNVESDGLIWIAIEAVNKIDLGVDEEIFFEIPLNKDLYQYVHHWAVNSKNNNLSIPEGDFKLTKPFLPYFWLGNDDIGLFWYSETPRNWPSGKDKRVIELIRERGNLFLKIWLKNKGKSFQGLISAHFGLMPTPVKPKRNLHRSMRIRPSIKANLDILWPSPVDTSFKYYGYPEAMMPQKFKKRVDILQQKGIQPMPYICPTFLSTDAPEWDFYKDRWFMGRYDSTSYGVRQYGGSFALVNPSEKSWRQFFTNKASEFLNTYNIGYVYYDNTKPYGGFNLSADVGYIRNGKAFKEYPINSYRDLYKGLDREYKSKGLNVISLAHISGDLIIPVLSYVDVYLDGEQFRGLVQDDYMDVLSLDSFRTEFTGKQWGLPSLFIPQFSKENAKKIAPTRGLMGLLMLHDVGVWPIWCNVEVVNKALELLLAFNYEVAEHIPYFSPHAIAFSKMRDVYVSVYSKDKEYLLVIVNLSKINKQGEVCLKKKNEVELETWPTGENVNLNENYCTHIKIDAQDYKMLNLKELQ